MVVHVHVHAHDHSNEVEIIKEKFQNKDKRHQTEVTENFSPGFKAKTQNF